MPYMWATKPSTSVSSVARALAPESGSACALGDIDIASNRLGRRLPLLELIAQVIQRVGLAVGVGGQCRADDRDQVGPVQAAVGQLGAQPGERRPQGRDVGQSLVQLLPQRR